MISVAVLQNDPAFGAKQQNVEQCLTMMRSVKADLYVLPELFATGYNFVDGKEARELAEPFLSGYTYHQIYKFASQQRCFVATGLPNWRTVRFIILRPLSAAMAQAGCTERCICSTGKSCFSLRGSWGFKSLRQRSGGSAS